MEIDGGGEMQIDGGESPAKSCLSRMIDQGGSRESHRLYLSRRTLLEMLRDRGYSVPDSEIQLSLQEFRNIYGQNPDTSRLRISASHQSHPSNKILAVFCEQDVVKVSHVRNIAGQIMNKESLSRLIVVIQNKITDQAMKTWDLFSFIVEVFQITDLLVNITKHELKPKHRILTKKEKEELLKKYSVEEKQLPRITLKDAIARYYALEKGQVLEITYTGDITEFYVTYRCVW